MIDPINIAHTSVLDLISGYLQDAFIIDFGMIATVYDEEVELVQVQIGACTNKNEFTTYPCIFGSLISANMSVRIKPKEGDRVIVFFPRRYNENMFDPNKLETNVDKDNSGYMYGKGIAFLASQFFETEDIKKNLLHILDEKITFATNKEIEATMGEANKSDTNKPLTLNVNGAKVDIDVDGNINVTATDTKAVTINGAKFTVSNGTVDISATKVTINGTSLEVS